MKQPTIGLVIASYKYGHLAAHAMESALAQTQPFDKIWFVDDGAGDCEHLIDKYADRVIFKLLPKNLGIVDNFQQMLMEVVDIDYVMFLGADNWLSASTVKTLQHYVALNYDIVTYDIIVTGELREDIHKNYAHEMDKHPEGYYWHRRMKHHGSMLYRTQLAKKVGGYAHNKTSERTDEDLNLWDKMIAAGARVAHEPSGLLYYRRHQNNFNKY